MPTDEQRSERPPISVVVPEARVARRPSPMPSATGFAALSEVEEERSEVERLYALRRGEGVELSEEAIARLLDERTFAAGEIFRRLATFRTEIEEFFVGVRAVLPPKLRGELVNPDGSPAASVTVEVLRPTYGAAEGVGDIAWASRHFFTDRRGRFAIDLQAVPIPQNGIVLRVRGGNGTLDLPFGRIDALNGDVGLFVLVRTLTPLMMTAQFSSRLHRSAVSQLASLFPVDDIDAAENIDDFSTDRPPLVLGEGNCAAEYRTEGGTVSQNRFSVLYRLTDPLLGPKILVRERSAPGGVGGSRTPMSIPGEAFLQANMPASAVVGALDFAPGTWNYRDRMPVEEPIDVDLFFQDLEANPRSVPKAATIGLGYLAKMRTVAINRGLSLGRLIYSLPLAPGEEQRIVISERQETLTVSERESMTFDEMQEFTESRDTSFNSTFETALNELIEGSSRFDTESETESRGRSGGFGLSLGGNWAGRKSSGAGAIVGGAGWSRGSASSSASGTSSASQNTARDFLAETHESFSSALERAASVKRRSARTAVRTATAQERQTATTKLIANRNHCHAMTMQWFEVLRDFSVETRIEGVQLVCLVPLQLVRFRNLNQSLDLPPIANLTRNVLLARYRMLLRHATTLRSALRGQRRRLRALAALERFAADPAAEPQTTVATAQDVVQIRVSGNFLRNENLSAVLVTKDGGSIGPVSLVGSPLELTDFARPENQQQLIAELQQLRRSTVPAHSTQYSGALALPLSIERNDLARVELRRRSESYTHTFVEPAADLTEAQRVRFGMFELGLKNVESLLNKQDAVDQLFMVTLSSAEFDREVGPPNVTRVEAVINPGQPDATTIVDTSATMPLAATLPLPSTLVHDVLSRDDILKIEALYRHVVTNTVGYSRAVWAGMEDDERAILLERYTIGVPEGGLPDASSEVPLLSAVANRVLGFFGNCMIMPFHIPPRLAEQIRLTTGDVQEALLRFHREDFRPTRRTLSLPTRGVLGEAVLGRCNSCEVIDNRRFWNWQDSPIPPPVGDAPPSLASRDAIFAARAPADLVANQPQNVLTIAGSDIGGGSAVPTSPLAEILKAAPDLVKSGADLTGLAQLQAQLQAETESIGRGRDKVVDASSDLTKSLAAEATKLTTKLAELTQGQLEEQRKQEERDDQRESQQQERESQQRSADAQSFDEFAGLAGPLSALVGSQPEAERQGVATNLLNGLPGGLAGLTGGGNFANTAKIFGAFESVNGSAADGSNQKIGSAVVLGLLGGVGF